MSSASFAGQLDSVLGLQTGADLTRAVLTCWRSYWSARALFYQTARSASLNGMAVIVQRQVDAKVSGVLFTHAPAGLTGAGSDDLMIEYLRGAWRRAGVGTTRTRQARGVALRPRCPPPRRDAARRDADRRHSSVH